MSRVSHKWNQTIRDLLGLDFSLSINLWISIQLFGWINSLFLFIAELQFMMQFFSSLFNHSQLKNSELFLEWASFYWIYFVSTVVFLLSTYSTPSLNIWCKKTETRELTVISFLESAFCSLLIKVLCLFYMSCLQILVVLRGVWNICLPHVLDLEVKERNFNQSQLKINLKKKWNC